MPNSSIVQLPRETLSLICSLLFNLRYEPGQPSPSQPDLASLASTCRSISEPALDVLWHSMASLVPLLLYTLPRDLCVALPNENAGINQHQHSPQYHVVFRRDPVADDFRRFLIYAGRVRMFSFRITAPTFDAYDVHPDVWAKLIRFCPKPMFPNIRRIDHREANYRDMRERGFTRGPRYSAEALLGPRLQTVHIDYGGWPSDQHRPTELVQAIARAAPLVKILSFFVSSAAARHISQYRKTAILACPETDTLRHLVQFYADSVHVMPAALAGLASLPTLETIILTVQADAYEWDALPQSNEAGTSFFPALAHLYLYEIPCEWCIAFVRAVTSSSLQMLEIRCWSHEFVMPGMLFEALCATLAAHPSRDTLNALRMFTSKPHPGGSPEAAVLQSTHIAPLLGLTALRMLVIEGNFEVIVDNATLAGMAHAWPHIGAIRFAWPVNAFRVVDMRKPEDANFPRATLMGVLPLLRGCPDLTALHIALDMRTVPTLDDMTRPPVPLAHHAASSIRTLSPEGSVYPAWDSGGPVTLVSFLSMVCPRIRVFPVFGDRVWHEESRRLYKALTNIREQERSWASRNGRRLMDPEGWSERGDTDDEAYSDAEQGMGPGLS